MSPNELRALLARGTTVAFDTNAVFGNGLLELANTINAWASRTGAVVPLAISVLPFVERQAQERRARGTRFDPTLVERSLKQKGVEIAAFEPNDAQAASAWLTRVAPSDAEWRALKRTRMRRLAGLSDDVLAQIPATVDWFIAAHAHARGWLLVTADGGLEFNDVLRCTPDALHKALAVDAT